MLRLWSSSIALLAVLVVLGKAHAISVEQTYRFYCAPCHGIEGRGDGPNATPSQPVAPRNHRSAEQMGKLSDEDIINVIKYGGKATGISTLMPPYKNTLSDEQIRELKDYLRKLCRCSGPR